jgi:hypothetical protein
MKANIWLPLFDVRFAVHKLSINFIIGDSTEEFQESSVLSFMA